MNKPELNRRFVRLSSMVSTVGGRWELRAAALLEAAWWGMRLASLLTHLFVCLLATSRKNFRTDLHDIFREGWQWAIEQMVRFRWRSRTGSPDGGTDIATLVRRALAEVCTVTVLLVVTRTGSTPTKSVQGAACVRENSRMKENENPKFYEI